MGTDCMPSSADNLSELAGVVAVICLAMVAPCFSCVPCMMTSMHEVSCLYLALSDPRPLAAGLLSPPCCKCCAWSSPDSSPLQAYQRPIYGAPGERSALLKPSNTVMGQPAVQTLHNPGKQV